MKLTLKLALADQTRKQTCGCIRQAPPPPKNIISLRSQAFLFSFSLIFAMANNWFNFCHVIKERKRMMGLDDRYSIDVCTHVEQWEARMHEVEAPPSELSRSRRTDSHLAHLISTIITI